MATTKAAGSGTNKAAKKIPARAPVKRAASKRAAGNGTGKAATAKSVTAKKIATTAAASRASAAKTSAKKTPATKAATRTGASPSVTRATSKTTSKTVTKAASRIAATSKTPLRTNSAATATPRPSATRAAARTAASGHGSARKSHKISPEQALANTRGLLEAKREHDRQPQSWQAFGPTQGHPGSDGFQSPSAMDKAEELHAAESRITPIQGSISTQDRHHQGKRDSR